MLWVKKREVGCWGRERRASVEVLGLVEEVLVVLVVVGWFFLRRESRCEMRRLVAANLRVFFARPMVEIDRSSLQAGDSENYCAIFGVVVVPST